MVSKQVQQLKLGDESHNSNDAQVDFVVVDDGIETDDFS